MPPSHMTRDLAYDLLYQFAGVTPDDDTEWSEKDLVRRARRAAHPDAGGSRDDWNRLEEALRTLGLL